MIPYGLFNVLSLNLYEFGNTYIMEGKFDRVLLRPVSSLFQILFENFRVESFHEALTGVVIGDELVQTVPLVEMLGGDPTGCMLFGSKPPEPGAPEATIWKFSG